MRSIFTSESVTEGHPDKIADQISDGILDAIMAKDPQGRVACETFVTTGLVMIGGEISTECYVDIAHIARDVIRDIGYTRAKYGFDCDTCSVLTAIDEQSADIALGVDTALEVKAGQTQEAAAQNGAGDQGMMFGYACDETPEYMPLPISLAHALTRRLTQVRKEGLLPYLRPDGKSQVSVVYEDGKPVELSAVVISSQHDAEVDMATLRQGILEQVIQPVLPKDMLTDRTEYLINPTGRFVVGGPQGDTGLTGRKIIVDTYGGMARHGGGCFSGKDPTKVDRSAAYLARYMAKNLVAAGLAKKCEIQLAYAIGVAEPVSVMADSFGTGVLPDGELTAILKQEFDMRPAAVIDLFDLRRPIYRQTAAYGHFGRADLDLPWERLDRVASLEKYRKTT